MPNRATDLPWHDSAICPSYAGVPIPGGTTNTAGQGAQRQEERRTVTGQLLETVEEWLCEDDWNFDRDYRKSLIKCGVKAENGSFTLLFVAREELEILSLLIVSPNKVPEDKRPTAAEFLTRANYGPRFGNFEMDMGDGEVRYKVSVDVEGSRLTPIMVKNMIGTGVKTMGKYFPGLMAISYTAQSAKDAIEQIDE